jgi:hypothetical protein
MSRDDWDLPRLRERLHEWRGASDPAAGAWDAALRLGCEALLRAPTEVGTVQFEGLQALELPYGPRLLALMDRAHAIAAEHGLQATVEYRNERARVTLARE